MKIIYLVNLRLPTEKAYGLQIAKTCEALASTGTKISLFSPYRRSLIKKNFFEYYPVKKSFEITTVAAPDFYLPGRADKIAFHIKNFISAVILCIRALTNSGEIIFSRDELPLYLLSFFRNNLVYEIHKFNSSKNFYLRRFRDRNFRIVAISAGLKKKLVSIGFREENILVSPDGVDIDEFNIQKTLKECRKICNLPQNGQLIGYVGRLRTMGVEKGVGMLISSFKIIAEKYSDSRLVIVGGDEADIETNKNLAKKLNIEDKVIFTGQKGHDLIPFYLKSFDVLVMPFPTNEHFSYYMSPLKLFEYMASKRPIVTSDLPSIREILEKDEAVFIKPEDSNSMAEGIDRVISQPEFAFNLAKNAFEKIKKYTWGIRAKSIINFLPK